MVKRGEMESVVCLWLKVVCFLKFWLDGNCVYIESVIVFVFFGFLCGW